MKLFPLFELFIGVAAIGHNNDYGRNNATINSEIVSYVRLSLFLFCLNHESIPDHFITIL